MMVKWQLKKTLEFPGVGKVEDGFSLVEVLVAVGIVAMVMTAVVSGVSFSVKNTRYAKDQALAVRYAQESLEWVRKVRDENGWPAFVGELGNDGNPISYCLMSMPTSFADFISLVNVACESGEVIAGTIFTREMTLDRSGNEVVVEVRVSWDEGGETKQVLERSALRNWQN